MHLLAVLALIPATVYAASMSVTVAQGGNLVFSPDTITANVGDTVTFTIVANHSVTATTFSSPCNQTLAGGFDSGFLNGGASSTGTATYTITVNDTNPIWIKCNQQIPENHCALGMVAAINPPTTGANTFANFQTAALASSTTTGAAASSTSCTTTTNAPSGYSYVTCNSAAKVGSGVGLFAVALATLAHLLF